MARRLRARDHAEPTVKIFLRDGRFAARQRFEQRRVPPNHFVQREMITDSLLVLTTELAGEVRVVNDRKCFSYKDLQVSYGSRLRVGEGPQYLRHALGGRTDDRSSASHRFEQHVGHSFPPRRQNHQVAGQQNLWHGRLPAGKVDPLRDAAFRG